MHLAWCAGAVVSIAGFSGNGLNPEPAVQVSLNRKTAMPTTPAIPLLILISRQRLQDAALLNCALV
jgi:hypothetical protein